MQIPETAEFTRRFNDPVWHKAATAVLNRHRINFTSLQRAEHGENIVFLVDQTLVIKIYTPLKNGYRRERAGLEFASGKTSLPMPLIVEAGEIGGYQYLILTQCEGTLMSRAEWLRLRSVEQSDLLSELAAGLCELHSHDASQFDFDWQQFLDRQIATAIDKQRIEGGNPEWIESMPAYFQKFAGLLPRDAPESFLHGDVHFGNLRVKKENGRLRIGGMFDLADSIKGFHEYEFVAVGVLMIQGQGELQREFFRSYGYKNDQIDETLRHRMFLLTMLYEHSSLRRYAERLGANPFGLTLEELERSIWSFA